MSETVSATSILLVEDEPETRRQVAAMLEGNGHPTVEAASAAEALARFDHVAPGLILLDLGLPDRDGLEVIEHVRSAGLTPILVISARSREEEKVAALDAGADDYLPKPFGLPELLARIGALHRRTRPFVASERDQAVTTLRVGALVLDAAGHTLRVGAQPVHLAPLEFSVLQVLLEHAGRLVTYGRLLRAVWGSSYDEEAHYIHVYVGQIRRKIREADPDGRLSGMIVSEAGVGYRVSALGLSEP